MPDSITPNFNFVQPEVGSSKGSWGTKLNSNWESLDSVLGNSGTTGTFLRRSGGTMTGPLILPVADPTNANQATRRAYVDTQVSLRITQAAADVRYLRLSGGTVIGQVASGLDPTAATHLARKSYVDAQISTRLTQAAADSRYLLSSGTTGYGRGIAAAANAADALDYLQAAQRGRVLTGGLGMMSVIGTLEANRTVTLGPPSAITADSTNSRGVETHSHALSELAVGALYARLGTVDVGSTIYARNEDGPDRNFGQNISGAALRVAGENGGVSTIGATPLGGGTWKCMGFAPRGFSTEWKKVA